jgi:hypothetical protein
VPADLEGGDDAERAAASSARGAAEEEEGMDVKDRESRMITDETGAAPRRPQTACAEGADEGRDMLAIVAKIEAIGKLTSKLGLGRFH